jgi:hypothetical protein
MLRIGAIACLSLGVKGNSWDVDVEALVRNPRLGTLDDVAVVACSHAERTVLFAAAPRQIAAGVYQIG